MKLTKQNILGFAVLILAIAFVPMAHIAAVDIAFSKAIRVCWRCRNWIGNLSGISFLKSESAGA